MIRWLPKAQKNLDTELIRISIDDELSAKRIAEIIKEKTEMLEKFPESGRPGRIIGTRELVFKKLPYIIPYRIRNNDVEILRFFHTSQKPPKQW